jgi:hypothetical protein
MYAVHYMTVSCTLYLTWLYHVYYKLHDSHVRCTLYDYLSYETLITNIAHISDSETYRFYWALTSGSGILGLNPTRVHWRGVIYTFREALKKRFAFRMPYPTIYTCTSLQTDRLDKWYTYSLIDPPWLSAENEKQSWKTMGPSRALTDTKWRFSRKWFSRFCLYITDSWRLSP